MADIVNSLKQKFSLQAFLIGMGVVCSFYALIFLYAFLNKEETVKQLEAALPSLTVLVEKNEVLVEEPLPEPPMNTEGRIGPPSLPVPDVTKANTGRLPAAPLPDLYENSSYGSLPVAKSLIETPYQAYKKPVAPADTHGALLSVAILNFGLSSSLSDYILKKLPGNVSLILSPYSDTPELWAKKARETGHEFWMELPLANKDFPGKDPGAKALMTNVSLRFNEERLLWVLGRAPGYAGVAAKSDNTLENAGPMFEVLIKSIFSRGLGYLELNTQDDAYIFPVAENLAVPRAKSNIQIDFLDAEEQSFEQLENKLPPAPSRITLYINPTPKSIDMLVEWLDKLEQQGVEIVPVSTFADLSVNE